MPKKKRRTRAKSKSRAGTQRDVQKYVERVKAAAKASQEIFEVEVFDGRATDRFPSTRETNEEIRKRWGGKKKQTAVILTAKDTVIIFNLWPTDADHWEGCKVDGTGHVFFETVKGWFTNDRRGVSDSFYPNDTKDPAEIIKEESDDIAECRDRHGRSIPVPGLPQEFLVTPERKVELVKQLKSTGRITFTPGGMGTGYTLLTEARCTRWGPKPGDPQLAAFFSVPEIFVDTFDHD